MNLQNHLKSNFAIDFNDLYQRQGLIKIDKIFCEFLAKKNPQLADKFFFIKDKKNSANNSSDKLFSDLEQSKIIIEISVILEDFLADFFSINQENLKLQKKHHDLDKISVIKKEFIQREIAKNNHLKDQLSSEQINGFEILKKFSFQYCDIDELEEKIAEKIFTIYQAENYQFKLQNPDLYELARYSFWAIYHQEGKKFHRQGSLFILAKKVDRQNLIPSEIHPSKRTGFDLTDAGFSLNRVLTEANYCIYCHNQGKDSCKTGLIENSINNSGDFKIDELGVVQSGCPLDQKISEMNFLKAKGFSIAALAVAVIDNPMIAATGHRICNDCSKSCIFQKQDAVDIPQIETRILKDVLNLPYGFEIYSLLTRWNPINFENNLVRENSGKKILVAGLGPAGFTLCHYLINSGHQVIAIDGLKIEPLDKEISGVDEAGNFCDFKPIKYLSEIYEPLSSRVIAGFGGVAEYGITSRFDKNFLKIIRLLLQRRRNFMMFGGIRFGSSINDKIAFEKYGFDHIALCIGAGKPNIINLKNNFAKGVRQASDFLMSLQLNGAYQENLFTNLQIRMPIVVIGGGLTAIDTACEAASYYLVQIKKFSQKVAKIGKEKIFNQLNEEEKIIAEEFLTHAKELENNDSDQVIKKLGGVKILYRNKIQNSPAYKTNHIEIIKAKEENIEFAEDVKPSEVVIDEFNHIKGLKCENGEYFSCKTLIIAAGTSPNISPVSEDNLDLTIDGKYFSQIKNNFANNDDKKNPSLINKINAETNQAISFFGDLHPNFEGSVVKAMQSAKIGYQQINQLLKKVKNNSDQQDFFQFIRDQFEVKIHKIEKLSDYIYQISIKSKLLSNVAEVGHIFRLQNYRKQAAVKNNQIMMMESVASTAVDVDRENSLITSILVDYGGSTSLIKNFKENQPCVFMGPSGKATEIKKNETVLLIGGGRGNQVLTSLAKVFKSRNCQVIFFAGYRKNSFVVNQDLMEKNSDLVVFSIEDEDPNLVLNNDKNILFKGSVIDALVEYFDKNNLEIDRILTIGNNQMMDKIAQIRHQKTVKSIAEAKIAITSLNSPMQCMMKGVCSQCLQKKKNNNGDFEYFYSCAAQDQNLDEIDFDHLKNRCEQNSLAEKITKLWLSELSIIPFPIFR